MGDLTPGAGARPVKVFTASADGGVSIEASVWPRELQRGEHTLTAYWITVRKVFREGGTDRATAFFRGSELHLVHAVMSQAEQFIRDQQCDECSP